MRDSRHCNSSLPQRIAPKKKRRKALCQQLKCLQIFVNEKRCIDEIVIFDCFCWNFQSVKGYVVMLGSTRWSWPWAVAAVAVTVVMAFSASIFKQRKRRKQLCKKRNAQVTSTHTENAHETWRYPLRKDTKRHLQTRAKPFLDCFQVGFLFKRVST